MSNGLVLQLQIEPGQTFAGSVGNLDDGPTLVFRGWVGFMAAVDELRKSATDPTPSSSARDSTPARPRPPT